VLEALAASALAAVRQWIYDAPAAGPIVFGVSIAFGPDGEPRVTAHGTTAEPAERAGGGNVLEPPLSAIALVETGPPPEWAEGVRRVDGSFAVPSKLKHVNPSYPPVAREAGEQGVVIVDARIEVDGRIRFARIVRSTPAFDQAALDAVLQWEFTPTLLDGRPIPVLLTITLRFTLA
jgi:TonB family protein